MQSEVWAIVPAGGTGSRFSTTDDKLLVSLQGVPVLVRTLRTMLAVPALTGVMVPCRAINRPQYEAVVTKHLPEAPIRWVTGGETRRTSVWQGLQALPRHVDIVLVHDAARALVAPVLLQAVLTAVENGASGAIAALPVYDTVKKIAAPESQVIAETLDRRLLWLAQTPQAFRREVLMQAHQQVPLETPVTDDAQLLELAGLGPVQMVPGDENNFKLTTQADLRRAEVALVCASGLQTAVLRTNQASPC